MQNKVPLRYPAVSAVDYCVPSANSLICLDLSKAFSLGPDRRRLVSSRAVSKSIVRGIEIYELCHGHTATEAFCFFCRALITNDISHCFDVIFTVSFVGV